MSSVDGVVITEVDPTGRAAAVGLRPVTVIASVANRPVNSVNEIQKALDDSQQQGQLLLLVKQTTEPGAVRLGFCQFPMHGLTAAEWYQCLCTERKCVGDGPFAF